MSCRPRYHIRVIYNFRTLPSLTTMMKSIYTHLALVAMLLSSPLADAFTVGSFQTRRSDLCMKRGRGSFKKEIGGTASSQGGMGSKGKAMGSSSSSSSKSINWCPIPDGQSLPTKEGSIGLLDTNLPTMKNSATNPTGAVAVAKFEDETFCFGSSCPSCKIPMTKANVLPATENSNGPRVSCSFCKSTYSLKTGAKLEAAEQGGMFSGVIKSVFAAQESGPLPVYKLGERNGKLVVAVD